MLAPTFLCVRLWFCHAGLKLSSVCLLAPHGVNLLFVPFFVSIPATAMVTTESSPVLCLYSSCPLVSRIIVWTQALSASFMYTCLFGPSIWNMFTVCSGIRSVSWNHSWMSNCNPWTSWVKCTHCRILPFCHIQRTTLPFFTYTLTELFILRTLLLWCLSLSFRRVIHSAHNLRIRKLSADWFDPRTVQPVFSRYTDFMKPEYSSPRSQQPCICPNPEPDKSILHSPFLFLRRLP